TTLRGAGKSFLNRVCRLIKCCSEGLSRRGLADEGSVFHKLSAAPMTACWRCESFGASSGYLPWRNGAHNARSGRTRLATSRSSWITTSRFLAAPVPPRPGTRPDCTSVRRARATRHRRYLARASARLWKAPLKGTSDFAKQFAAKGLTDCHG